MSIETKIARILHAGIIIAGIAGLVGCDRGTQTPQPQQANGVQPQVQTERLEQKEERKEKTLAEKTFQEAKRDYNNDYKFSIFMEEFGYLTNQKYRESAKGAAETFEENKRLYNAFILYDFLGDKESMKRVAIAMKVSDIQEMPENYLEYASYSSFECKRIGIELTKDQYNGIVLGLLTSPNDILNGALPKKEDYVLKGDELLRKEKLSMALRAYTIAKSERGMKNVAAIAFEKIIQEKTMIETEKEMMVQIAVGAYLATGEKESATRVAEFYFTEGLDRRRAESILISMGNGVTPDLLNRRADYWNSKNDFTRALDLYIEAGNRDGVKTTIKRMIEKEDRERKKH